MSDSKVMIGNAAQMYHFSRRVMEEDVPEEALDAARMAISDWYGVAFGATGEVAIASLLRAVTRWAGPGTSPLVTGGEMAAAPAALINGTAAHCLDFDDTHVGSIAHLTGPAWAAAWAVSAQKDASADRTLRAYLAGFEAGARLGNGGFGVAVNERRIHSTGVFGCFAAAVAAAMLLELDDNGFGNAIGLAATQVGGLTESFGTAGKPFHAGKAAFNGVIAAQMAAEGFEGAPALIDPDGGLARALVQDGAYAPMSFDYTDTVWEITRNTLKPYAACLLTHPVIDACRAIHVAEGNRVDAAREVRVQVNPLAIQIAGIKTPQSAYQGKFSLAFCAALGLSGLTARQSDFCVETLSDETIRRLVGATRLVSDETMDLRAATVVLEMSDGRQIKQHIPLALGNPDRPMNWSEMEDKFTSLAHPALGGDCCVVFNDLRRLGVNGSLPTPPKAVAPVV